MTMLAEGDRFKINVLCIRHRPLYLWTSVVLEEKWNVKSPGLHGRAGKGEGVGSKLVWSTLPSLLKIHHPTRASEEESCFWGWLHNFVLKWTSFITLLVLFALSLCLERANKNTESRISTLGLRLAVEESAVFYLSYACDAEVSQELGKF